MLCLFPLYVRGRLRILASTNSEGHTAGEIIASILDACQYWTARIRVMYRCNLSFKLLRGYLNLLLKMPLLLIKNDVQYLLFRVSRKGQRAHAKRMLIGLIAIVVIAIASFGLMQKATAVDTVVPDFSNVTADPYPFTGYAGNPLLTASMVTDRNANYPADPSLFYENNVWYMFFEVETATGEEIGFAKSTDAFHWNYEQIVLSDSQYRFSFPEVWKVNGIYYMTADCNGLGIERIYTTTNFPYGWTYASTLVSGKDFADPTVFYYNGLWWLYVSDTTDSNLYLYYSQSITGPYTQHPMSPIVSNDASKARPAGRTIVYNGEILRFAQKCDVTYGEKVRVFQVDTLTTTNYAEHEISASPLLSASGSGWNILGMHTLNAWWNETNWIEVVDGKEPSPLGNIWSIGIYYTTKSTLSITIAPTLAVKNVGQSQQFTSTVSGGTSPFTYQWYLNDAAVPSATSSTWTFTPISPGFYNVYANVTDNTVFTSKSNIATITVTETLSATISPASAVLDVGQSKQFTSIVSGGTSPYTYQWYLNGTVVSGANSSSLTLAPTSEGSYAVYMRVNDTFEVQTTSNTATVMVNVQPSATIAPSSVAMDIGQSQLFTSSVTGGTSPYSYQWYLTGAPVSGATSATWTFTLSSSASCTVSLEVTDSVGAVATSNAVPISVNVSLSITMAPVSAIVDLGRSQLFASTISGGTPPFAYQWYSNGAAVSGATSSMWTFTPISSGSYSIYVNVTDNVGVKAESNIAPITINPPLSVSVSPISVATEVGQSRLFTSTVSGGTFPYTYQWYLGGLPVSGATSATWTFSPSSIGSYTVYSVVSDSATTSTSAQSNTAHVTVSLPAPVNPQLSVTISPLTSTIYLSQSQAYTSDVAGTGTSPYSYQWYLNGNPVSGATSSTWTFTATSTGTYQIYVKVTDGASEVAQSPDAQLPSIRNRQ
jgi:predicted transcriptional regulator